MVLLAAVVGFPMLGPDLFPDLHHTAHKAPTTPYYPLDRVSRGLRPVLLEQGWASRLETTMTAHRAQHTGLHCSMR